ncbi:MAG TPA: tetratricopeptide repeat protein [Anaerolineae bacterium]|nr:tetratricopeptide repeat protein [Anaerolineae bacterium]
MIERANLIQLIRASRAAGRHDFAHTIATDWLAAWPGDHEIQLLLGEIEITQRRSDAAVNRLHALILMHPHYQHAYGLLGHATRASGDSNRAAVFNACGRALQGTSPGGITPQWANAIAHAVTALEAGKPEEAASHAQEALRADPDLPLPTLIVVRALITQGDRAAALAAARSGHDRWPVCVPFRLLLADDLLSRGDIGRGVDYFHQAVADDPLGFSANMILGANHAYRDLWPDGMQAPLSHPIPPEIRASLVEDPRVVPDSHTVSQKPTSVPVSQKHSIDGARPEPEPEPTSYVVHSPEPIPSTPSTKASDDAPQSPPNATSQSLPDDLPVPKPWESYRGPDPGDSHAQIPQDMQPQSFEQPQNAEQVRDQLDRLAAQIDNLDSDRQDRRLPAYVVLSSRTRLMQSFGETDFQKIDHAVIQLVEAVRRRSRWSAYRIYIDDPQTLDSFGLGPVDPGNAWQIKLRLADIDKVLAQRGEMVAALLIVGGDNVVPFHMLPNPTDDDDDAIPSDNPYATTDENYFAPEWPVGRFPVDKEADLLVELLLQAAEHHLQAAKPINWLLRFKRWLQTLFGRLLRSNKNALGYSASIWRKASLAVFRAIGENQRMITSPPVHSGKLPVEALRPTRLSYFNLHGLEDAPEWFGQRDPLLDTSLGIEFPVALHPEDVVNGGRAPNVVFTEACYGANSLSKTPETALCLKFLQAGSHAIIGSTKISYGSITPPLIAADLLGRLFWDQINHSLPVGEALRKAKLQLVARMIEQQDYLDGEDQKTLISFVLYGDPLYTPGEASVSHGQKAIVRQIQRPRAIHTMQSVGGPSLSQDDLDPSTLGRVKSIVSRYLPGMADADCRIRRQQAGLLEGSIPLPGSQSLSNKAHRPSGPQTTVITLAKSIPEGLHQHQHYARLTLDSTGKVLKLAVSR